ncbi:MAG: DUF1460 domain-containing protein [Candidatus Kapabacteria bacterium]|nr:DUF1460 domain-containing protein [Candidatus Kapabacteria bacterium]MDW8011645.1 DUF1460 domain-containing protein [Bacteroidota bacterium]
MQRRSFLLWLLAAPLFLQRQRDDGKGTITQHILVRMQQRALAEGWERLPIGVLMCRFGELFVGTPYVPGTLESQDGEETCRVDFTGMDCFTFVEATLCLARSLKLGKPSYDGFLEEVKRTRYRNGTVGDYTSRLHYTAEWLYENERHGVLQNITQALGGIPLPLSVSYMSQNPHRYPALRARPELLPQIAQIEQHINSLQHWYIPRHSIPTIERLLHSGDIIAFTTNRRGLDYGHLGLAYPHAGRIHLLHASQGAGKVVVDRPIPDYIATVPTHTGITVARPLEVA